MYNKQKQKNRKMAKFIVASMITLFDLLPK